MGARRVPAAVVWLAPRLALLLTSTLLALALGEAAIRVLGWYQDVDYSRYLAELTNVERLPSAIWLDSRPGFLWRHYPPFRPGAVALATTSEFSVLYRINDQGWRDGEHSYAKRAGIVRFLALGDSFTFGVGVPYGARFTDAPQRRLPGVEVVNMGAPGYGVDHALLAYLVEGQRYHPDAVLLFVHMGMARRNWAGIYADGRVRLPSDLAATAPVPRNDAETAYLSRDDPLFAGTASPVLRHSHLLSFAWYRIQLWRLHERLQADDKRTYRPVPGERSPGHLEDRDPERRRRLSALLAQFAAECRARGTHLVVVDIDDHFGLDYVRGVPGLEYLDLSDELYQHNRVRRVRYELDRHYTPQTHAFIGARLTEWIRARYGARVGP